VAEIEDLGSVIDESTLLDAEVDELAPALRFRLAILAQPAPGASGQPEVSIDFARLRRLAVRIQRVEAVAAPTPEQPWLMEWSAEGGPVSVPDIAVLNDWLGRFRGDLYGQPFPMFDAPDPEWLAQASIDTAWDASGAHVVDLAFDVTAASSGHVMELRAWFDDVAVSDGEGRPLELGSVVEAVRSWWRDFRAGTSAGQYGMVRGRE
jgi:hypothetical protein